VGEFRGIL